MTILIIILSIISAIVLLLAALWFLLKIRVNFIFSKENGKPVQYDLKVRLFGTDVEFDISELFEDEEFEESVKKIKEEIKKENHSDENKKISSYISKFYQKFLELKYTYREVGNSRIRKSVCAEKIKVNVTFGLDDAAKTGIVTGAVWTGIYDVIAFISGVITVTVPEITVTPDFENERLEFDGECVVVLHPVDFMRFKFINRRKKRLFRKNNENKNIKK